MPRTARSPPNACNRSLAPATESSSWAPATTRCRNSRRTFLIAWRQRRTSAILPNVYYRYNTVERFMTKKSKKAKIPKKIGGVKIPKGDRSEEHTSELQSLMRISYAVFFLKHKNNSKQQ